MLVSSADMLTCLSQYVLRALRWEEELELSRSCFEDHDILGLQSVICIVYRAPILESQAEEVAE